MTSDIVTVNVTVGWISRCFVWEKGHVEHRTGSIEEPADVVGEIAKALFLVALGQIEDDHQRDRLAILPDPRIRVFVRVDGRKDSRLLWMVDTYGVALPIHGFVQVVELAARGCYHMACGDLDTDAAAMPDPHDLEDPIQEVKGADYGKS